MHASLNNIVCSLNWSSFIIKGAPNINIATMQFVVRANGLEGRLRLALSMAGKLVQERGQEYPFRAATFRNKNHLIMLIQYDIT